MKYQDLTSAVDTPVFSRQDLSIHRLKVFDYQFTRWIQKGLLVRLKNGLYAFAREAGGIKTEEVAYFLYQPSYISLESALWFYGFIPEVVHTPTSVTSRTNRRFDNAFGGYVYRHIKKELFWGYGPVRTENGFYLLADPEKALLDYLYLNLSGLRSQEDFDAIRLDSDQLSRHLDAERFRRYLAAFDIGKLERWALKCLP